MPNAVVPLAADFPPGSRDAWLTLAQKALKGASPERLRRVLASGMTVEPLYLKSDPGTASAVARPLPQPAERPWDIRTEIDHPSPGQANADALQDLAAGAASLLVRLDPSGRTGVATASAADLARVLDGVVLDLAPVALEAGYLGPQAADWLAAAAKGGPASPLAFHLDPLSAFAESGLSPGPIAAHLRVAAETGARHAAVYPRASLFLASGQVVHEAGGGEAQELGFMLAAALAYGQALTQAGLGLEEAFQRMVLGLAVDGDFALSLAKLRAARVLWARMTGACGVQPPVRLEARSSRRMMSRLDVHVNMIRLTAAGFAAAVGGADSIVLQPFTAPLTESGEARASGLARRQVRNLQLVLMEEASLGRVADPAGGAWALEALTDQLARDGWSFFQQIERAGGAAAALETGLVAEAAESVRKVREADLATRSSGLIGVSEFADLVEPGVELIELDPEAYGAAGPDVGLPGPDSRCPPLARWRSAHAFEALRELARGLPVRPVAYVAHLGEPREAAARTGFVRNLLAAGGVSAQVGDPREYRAAEAPLAVISGPDARYAEEAAPAARALKAAGAGQVWLAGRPGAALQTELEAAGIEGFMFAGVDALALLRRALDAWR